MIRHRIVKLKSWNGKYQIWKQGVNNMCKLLILAMASFIIPFVLGFFARGPEWLMRPSMYLNLYLLKIANWGNKTKDFMLNKLNTRN